MNCEIIKDLLPTYVDGLTSSESNFAIEEHLKSCDECKQALIQMKTRLNEENVEFNKESIKPFKKLNKRIIQSVLITIAGCIFIVGLYFYLFEIGWKANSEDININYSYRDDSILIEFELTNGRELNAWIDHKKTTNTTITFTECFDSILDDIGNEFSYGFSERDQHGNMKTYTDEDYITLKFKDGTKTLNLKEIAEELGLQ